MHSRICLAAIIVMVIGAASSSYYPRWADFWDDGMLKNKLHISSDRKQFEVDLHDWFKRGETDLDLPQSTHTTLDALHAFSSSENLESYYDSAFQDHKLLKELLNPDKHIVSDIEVNEAIKNIKAFLTLKEMALEDRIKDYLDCRENAKKQRREAELAVRIVYDHTKPDLLLRAEETKKAAEESKRRAEQARLEAIEAQKDLGKDYRSVRYMDKYEVTALLNTSLLAFMTMLEEKMQKEKAFGALKLVPSLTDAFKLEVLSREILSAIPQVEIMDWLEEKIKENIFVPFEANQENLPGSTTGKQSRLNVAELATGKIEDLRDYVFTITLLENLPVLFEMARGGIQDMKLTSEAYELFIASIRDLLVANDDLLKATALNEIKAEIEDPKSTEWSTIMHKLIGITPTLLRTPKNKPHSSTTAFNVSRLNVIDTQIVNLSAEIDFVEILAKIGKNLFTESFKVDLIREKLRESILLIATMRVLDRQDVYEIIESAKEKILTWKQLNQSGVQTPNHYQIIEAIFKALQECFYQKVRKIRRTIIITYWCRLFPKWKSEIFDKYLELSKNKLLPTAAERNVQLLGIMNELASFAGKYFSKTSTLDTINHFYGQVFFMTFEKDELLVGIEDEAFDPIQIYCKHRYHLRASKNLKRIIEGRLSTMLNQKNVDFEPQEIIFLYDALHFVSRQPATSDDHGLTIFLAKEHVPNVVHSAKRLFLEFNLKVLSKMADKSRLFETELLSFDANFDFFDDLYAFTLQMIRNKGWVLDDFETWDEKFNFFLNLGDKTKNYLLFKLLAFIIFKPKKEILIQMPYPNYKDAIVRQTVEILEKNAESGFSKIVRKIHEKMMREKLGAHYGRPVNLSDMVTDFFGKRLKSVWLRDIDEMKSVEPIPGRERPLRWEWLKI